MAMYQRNIIINLLDEKYGMRADPVLLVTTMLRIATT